MQSWSRNLFRKNTSKKGSRRASHTGRCRGLLARLEALETRALLSATEWTPLGPAPISNGQTQGTTSQPVSGRVTGVAVSPADPAGNTVFLSTAGGGVWKTTDANGASPSWTPLTDHVTDANGNPAVMFMGSIAIAASDPNTIYVGTGEANAGGDTFYGEGVLKSTDGGNTWTLLGQDHFNRLAISKIVVDPNNPDTVYAAVGNSPVNGATDNKGNIDLTNYGIWKSTDGGATWTDTTAGQIPTSDASGNFSEFTDLVMDPANSQQLFAAVGNSGGSDTNGVYETADGGATWKLVGGGLPSGADIGRVTLAAAPSNGNVYYASFSDPKDDSLKSVWQTTTDGATWTEVTGNSTSLAPFLTFTDKTGKHSQGFYDTTLAVSPNNPSNVFIGGSVGSADDGQDAVIETANAGANWTGIGVDRNGNGPHSDHHAIGIDSEGRVLDGNDGGIFRYDPATQLWSDLNGNLNTIQFYSAAISPANPNIFLGGSQDNGTSRKTGNAAWTLVGFGDGGPVAFSPTDPTGMLAYKINNDGSFSVSADGGQSWSDPVISNSIDDANSDFSAPLAVAPTNGNEVIVGYENLWISTNAGANFENLTAGKPGWNPATNPTTKLPDTVDTIAIAPSNPNWIYAAVGGDGATSSQIFVSSNGGASWTEVDSNLPAGTGRINQLLVDPNHPQIAYAVVNQFGGAHVLVTANGGATWTDISGDLPDVPTYSIALNTDVPAGAPNILYVGTDTGVYTSTDGGAHWATLSIGLPNVQVDSLEYSSRFHVLVAGTHGRGAWEVTTLSPFLAGVPGDGTPQTFVRNLYRELLGREPDAAGEDAWSAFLAANNNSVGQYTVVQDIMNSPEYKVHYVTAAYQIFLDRMPDAAGLQFWVDKMGNPGTPGQNGGSGDEKYIVAAFMGSDEFYYKAGNTPQAWINAVYEDVFNRPAEAAGVAYWTNDAFIRALGGRDGIVRLLLTSPEAAHHLLDAFYPLPGSTATAPGTTAGAGGTPLALLTGGGWENLYLEGPYDGFPEAYDAVWASLAGGGSWDDIQVLLLSTPQAFNNPNRLLAANE